LGFLRADAAAHGGQGVGAFEDSIGPFDILLRQGGDETGNVDAYGAARDAARLLAADAALGFVQGAFEVQAERHFLKIMRPHLGLLVRHGRALGRNGLDVLGQAGFGSGGQRGG
jgi:hypothetical protein